jgi:hypothetical protein
MSETRAEYKAKSEAAARFKVEANARRKKSELEAMATVCRAFTSDERYKDFKGLFEVLAQVRQKQLLELATKTKSNEEYLRMALIFTTEISMINKIFNTPEMFINEIVKEQTNG